MLLCLDSYGPISSVHISFRFVFMTAQWGDTAVPCIFCKRNAPAKLWSCTSGKLWHAWPNQVNDVVRRDNIGPTAYADDNKGTKRKASSSGANAPHESHTFHASYPSKESTWLTLGEDWSFPRKSTMLPDILKHRFGKPKYVQ